MTSLDVSCNELGLRVSFVELAFQFGTNLEKLENWTAVPTFSRFVILVSSGTGFIIPVSGFLIPGSDCNAAVNLLKVFSQIKSFSKFFVAVAVERHAGAPLPTRNIADACRSAQGKAMSIG